MQARMLSWRFLPTILCAAEDTCARVHSIPLLCTRNFGRYRSARLRILLWRSRIVPAACALRATACTVWGQPQYPLQVKSKSMRFGMHPLSDLVQHRVALQSNSSRNDEGKDEIANFKGHLGSSILPFSVTTYPALRLAGVLEPGQFGSLSQGQQRDTNIHAQKILSINYGNLKCTVMTVRRALNCPTAFI